ncbi:ABC transporter substrate-binding protein [Orrella sp. 11846]|uniref:ABC transporter substrate-binding protein n=1 Tax=Orrella sp. 11846 TaxID=3409913 RepID=UPI003B5C4E46
MSKSLRVLPVALACAFAFGMGSAQADELRIGLSAEPSSIDPHYHNLAPNNALVRQVYEPLLAQGPSQELLPGLAESWAPVDDTTWEFKIRKNAKFGNGNPVTVDDVIATMERVPDVPRSPASFAQFLTGMKFEKVDDHTLHVKTDKPSPLVPNMISVIAIVAKECADNNNFTTEDFNALKCDGGSGPFKFSEFKPGDRTVMVKNPHYWGEDPGWDKVTFRYLTSGPTRVAGLLADDVDVIEAIPPTDIAQLRANPNINVTDTLSNRVIYLHMDQFRENSPFVTAKDGSAIKNPLLDQRVRQAMSMAINRPAIAERIMDGAAVPAEQVLAKSFFGTSQNLEAPKFDLAGAKKLLEEAGYKDGFKLKIHGPAGRYTNDTQILEAVAQMLTRLGLDVEIETMPPANFFTRASTGADGAPEFSMILAGWGAGTGETSGSLRSLMGTVDKEKGSGAANRGRYSNPVFDAKLDEALTVVDDAKRAALLGEASEIGFKDLGIIPIHYQTNVWASKKDLDVTARADEYSVAAGIKKK